MGFVGNVENIVFLVYYWFKRLYWHYEGRSR